MLLSEWIGDDRKGQTRAYVESVGPPTRLAHLLWSLTPYLQLRAVYVANAPVTISKNDVRGLFEKFGEIESIFLSAELPKKVSDPTFRLQSSTPTSEESHGLPLRSSNDATGW